MLFTLGYIYRELHVKSERILTTPVGNQTNSSNATKIDVSGYNWWVTAQCIQASIGLIGMVTLYYIILFSNKRKFRKNLCFMLVAGQVMFDFIFCLEVSVTLFPRMLGYPMLIPPNSPWCTAEGYFYLNMVGASLSFSGLVSYERYRAVCFPFNKFTFAQAKKVFIFLLFFNNFYLAFLPLFLGGYWFLPNGTHCIAKYHEGFYFLDSLFTVPITHLFRFQSWKHNRFNDFRNNRRCIDRLLLRYNFFSFNEVEKG